MLERLTAIFQSAEMREVYANILLRDIALAMIGIFIPIYLLTIGYALPTALVFLMLFYGVQGLTSPLALWAASHIGVKRTITVGIVLFIIFLSLLTSLETLAIPIPLLGVLAGVSGALYWVPLNIDLAQSSDQQHRGEEVGMFFILARLAFLIGPFAGGLIITVFGFPVVYGVGIGLLLLSVVPFFTTPELGASPSVSLRSLRKPQYMRFLPHFGAEGTLLIVELFLWPLFVFLTEQSTVGVGAVGSLKGIGAILFAFVAGRLIDANAARWRPLLIRGAALGLALVSLIRIYGEAFYNIYALSIAGGLLLAVIRIPFISQVMDHANVEDPVVFMMFREMGLGLSRALAVGFVILLLPVFPHITAAFMIAMAAAALFITYRH